MLLTNPNETPDMSATSLTMILLLLRTICFTQPTFSSVLLVNGHPVHLATLRNSCHVWTWKMRQKLVFFPLSTSYFQHFGSFRSTHPQFKAKTDANTLFLQVSHFLRTPQLQMEYRVACNKTLLSKCVLQPYTKQEMTLQALLTSGGRSSS
jgi:hypothetical protein